jgi:hypothetical protein
MNCDCVGIPEAGYNLGRLGGKRKAVVWSKIWGGANLRGIMVQKIRL